MNSYILQILFGHLFMNIISIIPARGGSKGVPRKNIKLLAGKPLIAYTIETALASSLINRIIVSTDDAEIAKIAFNCGAEVVMRPNHLARDETPTEPVLQHVVNYLEKKENYIPDLIMLLQPTSPLRHVDDIDNSIKQLMDSGADSLLSVCKNHIFLWKMEKDVLISINYNYKNRKRRQNIETEYRENGSIYITKRSILMKENNRLGGKIEIYEMDEMKSFEIDTMFDFKLIECILN